jgi:hypothetical protein
MPRKKKRTKTKNPHLRRRGVQLHRALAICLHLMQYRYGETQKELCSLLEGRCCARTVLRDLGILEALGCVRWEIRKDGQKVWHWVPIHVMRLLEGMDDAASEIKRSDQEPTGCHGGDLAQAL